MSELVRFGVSIEKSLVNKFDNLIRKQNYSNRSEALRDLIRNKLVENEWKKDDNIAASISLVYDHHKRDLQNKLTDVQHDFQGVIISSQHVHLDHDNCLEIIIARGRAVEVQMLANKLKAEKGVKHGQLTMATTGKDIK